MFTFVDHGLRLPFSIQFGIAVSLAVHLVRGGGVSSEGQGKCAISASTDGHGLVSLSSMVQYMIQLIKAQKEIEGNNGAPNKSADNQPASTSTRSGYKG